MNEKREEDLWKDPRNDVVFSRPRILPDDDDRLFDIYHHPHNVDYDFYYYYHYYC